jgi:hypothetical protein
MSDSVIFVTVRSRFAGRKFFTPEMRFSKFAPTPVAARRSVRRLEMLLKLRKRSEEGWMVVVVWEGLVVEVNIVIRVVARTLEGGEFGY